MYKRRPYISIRTFQDALSVRVVSSSSGYGLSQATEYISCIFEAKFFINNAIKSATVLAHRSQKIYSKSSKKITIGTPPWKPTPLSAPEVLSQLSTELQDAAAAAAAAAGSGAASDRPTDRPTSAGGRQVGRGKFDKARAL